MVLFLAVHDALHGPKNVPKQKLARLWQEARDYITAPSEDLAMVCAMAGVNMDAVIERMRVHIAKSQVDPVSPCGDHAVRYMAP
jgi:hypothetical protein